MIFLDKRVKDMYNYIKENEIPLTAEEEKILNLVVSNLKSKKEVHIRPKGIIETLLVQFKLMKIKEEVYF